MGRHSQIQLTEELEKEVIDFYLIPKSAREVERVFGLNLYQLNKVLIKYGINAHNNKVTQDLKKQQLEKTLLERYGVTSTFKSEEILQKCKQTNLARYGFDYAMKSPDLQQKSKETCVKNHDGRLDVGRFGSIEHKKWAADKKYLEKSKQTCLKRYGVEYITQSDNCKAKSKQTCLKKFGVESPLQSPEIMAKRRETCFKKYGNLNNYEKISATLYKNNTFNSSSAEVLFYDYLLKIHNSVEKQYSWDSRYPFACDFYIPSEDLFIELNLSQTHGKRPFDENNPEDLALLEKQKEKAKTSKYYRNAIETQTVRDVKKLKTAKENKLNYQTIYIDEQNQLKKEIETNAKA